MPYKNAKKQRQYQKDWMREYRRRKKAEARQAKDKFQKEALVFAAEASLRAVQRASKIAATKPDRRFVAASVGGPSIQIDTSKSVFNLAVEELMEKGISREEAEKRCREAQGLTFSVDKVFRSPHAAIAGDAESKPDFVAEVEAIMKENKVDRETAILTALEYQRQREEAARREDEEEKAEPEEETSEIHGREATSFEKCVGLRRDVYAESEAEARVVCKRIFEGSLIKIRTGLDPETIFASGDATKMVDACIAHDKAFSMEPRFVAWREEKKLQAKFAATFGSDSWQPKTDADYRLKRRMRELYGKRGPDGNLVFTPYELWKIALNEQQSQTARVKKEHDRKSRLTVGSLYKPPPVRRIASIHDEDDDAFLACVTEHMETHNMSRKEAEEHCRRRKKEIPQT